MAYEHAPLCAGIAAELADDPLLMQELTTAFLASARDQVAALGQAVTASEWHMAAWRFKGLCASFGLTDMAAIAHRATESGPRDAPILQELRAALAVMELSAGT